ncbi:MAG: creatininase family protein [Gemmatimonadota bacterium]|nr:creatininase family protein [Gemmatimonadota bacterium]
MHPPRTRGTLLAAIALASSPLSAQDADVSRSMGGGDCEESPYNCAGTPNPLPDANTVWIEEMTWMDVRDALHEGKTTAIIPTGGVEPNGPWLATGKHNYVLRANCDAIARRLGDALCAPVVKLVPEGSIDPPSGHMTSPGTLSATRETFEALLTDIARSLKAHGFRNIIFIGDSGGNQAGQRAVAERLNEMWDGTVVAHVQEYYDYGTVDRYMAFRGFEQGESDGLHDDPIISLNMLVADPASIRYDERVEAGLATINGVSLADRVQALEWGREIVDFRAAETSKAIRTAVAHRGTLPAPERRRSTGGGGPRPEPDPRSMGGGNCAVNEYNCDDTPNPLPEANTVWIEEMTWMDVRDALADGRTTAIIPTGGLEPNGPWLVTGKHNYVLRANCEAVARTLENALCAPVLAFVPEGGIEPPTGHMTSPGTISLRQETFEAVLTDMANSLQAHGFEHVVFIGDSGGNQRGMENVATRLDGAWGGSASAHYIPEYYDYGSVSEHMRDHGLVPGESDDLHDDPVITLNMFFEDPRSVRYEERLRTRQAHINGFSIADREEALELAREIVDFRASVTSDAIRSAIASTN